MRKIILLAVACCFLQSTFAESIFSSVILSPFSLLVQPQMEVVPSKTIQKRLPLKERLLLKWYKKKMERSVSEERAKKNIKLLGILSIGASVLSPLLLISLFAITSYEAVQVLAIFALLLLPTAIIIGIISLNKRKKLADKSGTSNVPAYIGIAIASLFIIIILIGLISFSVNGFG